jgi:2-dehydropantoate 2-reductase
MWAASMMRDIDAGARRIEAEAIVGDMLQRGASFGVSTPILDIAYCHLQAYEIGQSAT